MASSQTVTAVQTKPVAAPACDATSQAGAKALFYFDGQAVTPPSAAPTTSAPPRTTVTTPSRPRPVPQRTPTGTDQARCVGVHYWIELEGAGPVTAERTFRSGDRIKLHLRSNVDGYLALWTLDPTGQGSLLFPTGGEPNSAVKADSEYVTPGFIRFQPPAQDERLLVFFSKTKADLPTPSAMPKVTSETEVVARYLGPTGARALVFETDQKTPAEVGTYVVNQTGGPIVKEIRLKHQAQ